MGADFPEDALAIEMLREIPREVQELIGHHLNNSLAVVISAIETGHYHIAKQAAWHMAEDLKKFGINNFNKKGVRCHEGKQCGVDRA